MRGSRPAVECRDGSRGAISMVEEIIVLGSGVVAAASSRSVGLLVGFRNLDLRRRTVKRFALPPPRGLFASLLVLSAAVSCIEERRPSASVEAAADSDLDLLPGRQAAAAVLRTIRQRRTVRRYRTDSVPREDLMAILDAARYAPTAANQQPWRFLVVQDRQKLEELEGLAVEWYLERVRAAAGGADLDIDSLRVELRPLLAGALSAPVYVAVLVDSRVRISKYLVQDGSLAAGYLMIAARALGYGTGFFTTFFPEEKMREFFAIPDRFSLICFTPIGVPEAWPTPPPKKGLAELVVFESFTPEPEKRHD